MSNENGAHIEAIFGQLERVGQLRAKELITAAEFEETRGLLSAELLSLVRPTSGTNEPGLIESQFDYVGTLPFGEMHDRIVDVIAKLRTNDGLELKEGAIAAIARMSEGRVLNPGDSPGLMTLVEAAFEPERWSEDPPLKDANGAAARLLLQQLSSLTQASARVRTRAGASPAAIAIADTAQHSAYSAAQTAMAVGSNGVNIPPSGTARSLWRKLVLSDVSGAFQGGAAAAAIAPAFGALAPVALPLAAAFGVVIGAGIQSGLAYGDLPK